MWWRLMVVRSWKVVVVVVEGSAPEGWKAMKVVVVVRVSF
jgi:hypothetical protein